MNKYDKSQLHQPACVNGRRTRNYICLVDTYRRPSRQRNTAGRYRVGAKNPKAARKLLQSAIGFGTRVPNVLTRPQSATRVSPYCESQA